MSIRYLAVGALLAIVLLATGCAEFKTYLKDRVNDFADCFKADIGILGVGIEGHIRITDAIVTGIGVSDTAKIGFKGRHAKSLYFDRHVGLPFCAFYWFSGTKDGYKEFPITYYGLVGDEALPFMGRVKGLPGSYEAESILFWPKVFEKDPRRCVPQAWVQLSRPGYGERFAYRPYGRPFQKDIINSFDIEAGATVGLFICLSAHVGFSPGQFLDFLLGWFGLDIGKDDYRSAGEKIEKLCGELRSNDKDIRLRAASILREMADKRALPALVEALKDEDKDIRSEAAEILKEITKQDFGQDYEKWKAWSEKDKNK